MKLQCQLSGKSLAVATVRSTLANAEVDRAVGGCHHSQHPTGFTNDHDGQHCENLLEHADILSGNNLEVVSWQLCLRWSTTNIVTAAEFQSCFPTYLEVLKLWWWKMNGKKTSVFCRKWTCEPQTILDLNERRDRSVLGDLNPWNKRLGQGRAPARYDEILKRTNCPKIQTPPT